MLIINNEDRVRTIALNRPDALNAFNGQQYDEVTDALLESRRLPMTIAASSC